jgi:hypothetical protein
MADFVEDFLKPATILQLIIMKRIDFLKKICLVMGIPLLTPKRATSPTKTCLLQFHVRGFQYYHGTELLPLMNAGELLKLVREPKNKFDEYAIALHYRDKKIGFVPAEKNEVLSRLMDSGSVRLRAEIIEVDEAADHWEALYAAVYLVGAIQE